LTWGKAALVEELRIGELDGDDNYLFGRVAGLAVDGDGGMYVVDSQLKLVRKYDANGVFERNIGREGEGPGEYRRILGIRCLPNGTVALLTVPHRIILYSKDGSYLRDFRVESGLQTSRMLEYDLDNHVYIKATAGNPPAGDEWEFVLLKYTSNGELLERVRLPSEARSHEAFTLIFPEGALSSFPIATCSAWSPFGYLVVGRNDEYVIEVDGQAVIDRTVDRAKMDPREKNEWNDWAQYMGQRGTTYKIPDIKPYYRSVVVADDGRIWVHRYVNAEQWDAPGREPGDERPILRWREPTTFDVFDDGGKFIGTVVVPEEARLEALSGRHVWGVQVGDDGYQVVRWRVEPGKND
jgi:hypothetical protein